MFLGLSDLFPGVEVNGRSMNIHRSFFQVSLGLAANQWGIFLIQVGLWGSVEMYHCNIKTSLLVLLCVNGLPTQCWLKED